MQHNRQSWNKHAARYFEEGELRPDTVDYCGAFYPTDDDLHLIGDVQGKKVIEIGSGWGNCGIALAKRGADVACVDLSDEQIAIGERVAEREGVRVRFVQSDMADLSAFNSESADIVLSICALQYAEDLQRVFREVARVLKPGGVFIFSVEHPVMKSAGMPYAFSGPTEWKWDEDDDFTFVSFRRPISAFVNTLGENGLFVQRMEELFSKKNSPEWPEDERVLRGKLPSILVIKAVKEGSC